MKELVMIGSTVADVVVRVPCLPQTGDDVNVAGQTVSLGGCAYNVFAAARLLGAACTLCSPVGGGLWGGWVRQALAARGVESIIPPVAEDNGCCYCLVEPDGERTFLCEHGAEYRFRREWLDAVPMADAGVYVCGLEIEEDTGGDIIDALEGQLPGTLYFAPGPRICRIKPQKMARMMALHPVLHLNAEEALAFTRQPTVEEAAALIHHVTRNTVIITLGAEGAYVLAEEGALVPGVKAHVTDTIGAGDAHIGAIMAARAFGMGWSDAVALANRVSAAVVEQSGAELTPAAWATWKQKQG